MKKFRSTAFLSLLVLTFVFPLFLKVSELKAFSLGGGAGMEFPLTHTSSTDPGVSAEGFYRIDPFEVRFHYAYTKVHSYSVLLGIKKFFTDSLARPYIEGALGPLIVRTPGKGMAYGFRPEVSLGVDLGLSDWLSTGVVTRYAGWLYFGNTRSGSSEYNHSLSILANLVIWF